MAIISARLESAQHILLRILMDDYSAEQCGMRAYPDKITLDVKSPKDLTQVSKEEIEEKVNSVVQKKLDVTEAQYNRDEVPKGIDVSIVPENVRVIRIVSIGDFDSQACHELHVSNTEEIGVYKLLEVKRNGKDTYRFVNTVGNSIAGFR